MALTHAPELSASVHVDTFCRDNLPPFEQWPQLLLDGPGAGYGDRLNCAAALLDDVVERLGRDRPCLRSPDGRVWSYGQVLDTANQVAGVLTHQLGVVPGNRVLLRGPNNPWLVMAWFGVLKAGAVVVTTMPLLRRGELDDIVDIAQIEYAICDYRFLDEMPPDLTTIPYGGSDADDLTARCAAYEIEYANAPTAADDVSMLAFTSGTTGRPKATMHFHRDVLAIADTFSQHVLKPEPDDVFIGTPPLAFTFGLGGLVIFPMRVGASTMLVEKATPLELAELIAQHRVTVCFTAPTAYRSMVKAGDTSLLSSLRRGVSAGEHLDADTWQAVSEATGLRLIDGIGSTEMLHVFISASDDDIRPGATGVPVPGFRARILDENGQEAPDGTPGRLAVQGPTGCRYLRDERQSTYVADGWNITGDTFTRDSDGYFWYLARSDDMIVSSGYNIGGPEVEQALMTHEAVFECAVIGVPDDQRGSIVKAYVVLAEGYPDDDDVVKSIQEHVKDTIAPYKYPRQIEFIDALPRGATGKLQRFRLRQT